MRWLQRVSAVVVASLLLVSEIGADDARLDGNEMLLRAADVNRGLRSFSVPIHFNVHLHKPFGVRLEADAVTYFRAPNKQALVIKSLPPFLGRSVSRRYGDIDTIPQTWPGKYQVQTVTNIEQDGGPILRLDATPKYEGDITHVAFDISKDALVPVAVTWYYRDGSTIVLTLDNARVGRYMLPRSETISVSMPRFKLDAEGTTGTYELDRPIPDSVFAQ